MRSRSHVLLYVLHLLYYDVYAHFTGWHTPRTLHNTIVFKHIGASPGDLSILLCSIRVEPLDGEAHISDINVFTFQCNDERRCNAIFCIGGIYSRLYKSVPLRSPRCVHVGVLACLHLLLERAQLPPSSDVDSLVLRVCTLFIQCSVDSMNTCAARTEASIYAIRCQPTRT